jgi:hypothetical protein
MSFADSNKTSLQQVVFPFLELFSWCISRFELQNFRKERGTNDLGRLQMSTHLPRVRLGACLLGPHSTSNPFNVTPAKSSDIRVSFVFASYYPKIHRKRIRLPELRRADSSNT